MQKLLAWAVWPLFAIPSGAQSPRIAPPPACPVTARDAGQAILALAGPRDSRPVIAVLPLTAEIDDPDRVHLATTLPARIGKRLATHRNLNVVSEGRVSRALFEAKDHRDSALRRLRPNYVVMGRFATTGTSQEVVLAAVRTGEQEPVWTATFRSMTSPLAIENAVVSGLSRTLASASAPPLPEGWPSREDAHDALIAGDAHVRGVTAASADSAYRYYQRARQADAASPIIATRLALAAAAIAERGGTIPDAGTTPPGEFARRLVSQAMAADSTSPDVWTARAILARHLDPVAFEGAVAAHERALALDRTNARAEHEYGITLLLRGDTRGADTHLRRALALDPGRAASLAALGEIARREEQWGAACALTNASIAAWPYDPSAYAIRAQARLHLNDTRDAFSDAELVGRLTTGAWTQAVRLLITSAAGRVDIARRQVDELTVAWLAPGRTFGVRDAEYLAMAYLVMGDQRRAIESLKRARPVGAELGMVLRSRQMAAIRSDTAVAGTRL
jgi:tetratricopeptide (TPR) repeat protein/TolB-like protein